jgi:hypothetical protein
VPEVCGHRCFGWCLVGRDVPVLLVLVTHGRHGREVAELVDKFLRDFKVTQYVRTLVPSTFKKCVALEQGLADRIQADRHENT